MPVPAGSNRNLVAMALSGFTDDKNTLWKEMCGPFSTQLKDPYLRAMFAFLVNGSGDYDGILVSIARSLTTFKINFDIYIFFLKTVFLHVCTLFFTVC